MPRPHTVNKSILRLTDSLVTDMQRAEELIRREMIVMLHYDALHSPVVSSKKTTQESVHADYLVTHPYREYQEEELEKARELLRKEMQVVKQGMNHGELTFDAYNQVWEECLAQVLFLPSQSRFTRASLASKKDRIESLEKRLDQNRAHMAQQAKRAAKLEKKLKILLGGYMARAATLSSSLTETQMQVESSRLELSTFNFLQELENIAVPKRLSTLQEDVERQKERERDLQRQYQSLNNALEELQLQYGGSNEEDDGQKEIDEYSQHFVKSKGKQNDNSDENSINREEALYDNDEYMQEQEAFVNETENSAPKTNGNKEDSGEFTLLI